MDIQIRGKQNGEVVFSMSGEADFVAQEALRYAIQYASEGEVTLERKIGRSRWNPNPIYKVSAP